MGLGRKEAIFGSSNVGGSTDFSFWYVKKMERNRHFGKASESTGLN